MPSFGNESVIGSYKILTDDDDITFDFPELIGALYIENINRQATGTTGRATDALKQILNLADKQNLVCALTAISGGQLDQEQLTIWYTRHGFTHLDNYVMLRRL